MLDGSRRIIAYLLNDISNINVYLLGENKFNYANIKVCLLINKERSK